MKSFFGLFVFLVCSSVFAGDNTQSVLAPTPAEPTTAATADKPVGTILITRGRRRCANGCCGETCQAYTAEEQTSESCRRTLGGGYVIRKNSRTFLRPVR